ncbi:hypothetical protein B5E58_02180 [Tyzzerella sp. An114]|uniref:DegV family protein n=1 Tax=Tyzzerella sp. An114 TaxID=1965545 RepID=UPI000B44ACC5|nr:DegV family protein [Tyzzerella sp. An114]OUQ59918.1 hypothetical protein B5E58_02180 [Tyzzerella sp. An114]
MGFKIVCDTSADLTPDEIKELNIDTVSFYISFDGVNYEKELSEITIDDFYKKLIDEKLFGKTSMPTIQDYSEVFEKHLKNGDDIICICLSSKFSGSYASAVNAKKILEEEYPERKITVIDSTQVTVAEGLIVKYAVDMQRKGFSYEKTIETINKVKETARIYFTVDSLEHLKQGGRIGKASAFAGALLNIKPVIVMKNGELIPEKKVRGHKKALQTLVDYVKEDLMKEKDQYEIQLINVIKDDSIKFVTEELTFLGFKITEPSVILGSTIATHAGPTVVGICYIKKYEYL